MKKSFKVLFVLVAVFMAWGESQAQTELVIKNLTDCKYEVEVFVAGMGTCTAPYPATTVFVPENSTINYVCPTGLWVVGAHLVNYGIGLSSPIPGPCIGFPSNATFMNFCTYLTNAQYVQGPPVPYATPGASPSILYLW
ncbi:hypothetical protein KFE94_15815 [bacterium SCSIO 12643]|nr:hypothetical protein KFE94_15815 [bacterium SCSIO 12643]